MNGLPSGKMTDFEQLLQPFLRVTIHFLYLFFYSSLGTQNLHSVFISLPDFQDGVLLFWEQCFWNVELNSLHWAGATWGCSLFGRREWRTQTWCRGRRPDWTRCIDHGAAVATGAQTLCTALMRSCALQRLRSSVFEELIHGVFGQMDPFVHITVDFEMHSAFRD